MVVNEVHSLVLDYAEVLSYADDLAIVISHPTRALELAQRAMNMVSSKCKELGLKISGSKTTAMSYFNYSPPTSILLDGVPLEWRHTYKYLGIIFDRRLTFAAQVKSLSIRMSARLNVMRSISQITWGANKTNLGLFYQQAIVSLVDYAAPALHSLSPHPLSSKKEKRDFDRLFKRLDNLQLSASRTLIGAPRIAKVTLIIKEANLPSIRDRVLYIGRSFLASMASKVDSNLGMALEDHFKGLHLPQHEAIERLSMKFQILTQEAYQAGARLFEPVIKEPCNPLEVNPFLVKVAGGFKKEEVPAISLRTLAEEEISYLSEAFPNAHHIFTDGSVMPDSGRAGSAAFHPHSNPPEVLRERVTDGASTLSTELHAIDMSLKRWSDKDLVIHTDSLGSIQKLANGPSDNPLARSIQLLALARQDRGIVTLLHWVPSHVGLKHNERVDSLAREAAVLPTPPTRRSKQSKIQIKRILRNKMLSEKEIRDEARETEDAKKNPNSQSRLWNALIHSVLPAAPRLPVKSWQSAATRFRLDYRRWGDIPNRSDCACGEALFSVAHVLISCTQVNRRSITHLGDPVYVSPHLSERLRAIEVIRRAAEEQYKPLAIFCRDNQRLLW